MDRRWPGLLVLLVVLLVAVMVPNVVGKPVAGRPQAERVAGPPAIGDCLTLEPEVVSRGRGSAEVVPRSPQPCNADHYAEVVAVIHGVPAAGQGASGRATADQGATVTDDRNRVACSDAVWRYLGVPVGADHVPVLDTYWSPVAFADARSFGPLPRQRSSGQTWVACVLHLADTSGWPISYVGSSRNGYAAGTVPTAFALCLYSRNLNSGAAGTCGAPHPMEVFAATSTAKPGLSQQLLDVSCRRIVDRLTKMPDPTAGGRLEVRALTIHDPAKAVPVTAGVTRTPTPGLGTAEDQSGFAACVVVAPGSGQLSGSLLGLATKPVPWAN